MDASYKTLYGKHFKRTFVLFLLRFLCSNPEKAEFIELVGRYTCYVHD